MPSRTYGRQDSGIERQLYVAGFCWGGGQSFSLATQRKDLAPHLFSTGRHPQKSPWRESPRPCMGFTRVTNARIGATLPDTRDQMKASGKTFDPVIYDGAGHGFMRAGEAPDASDANRKARNDAWVRWKKLLAGGQ